MNSCVSFAQIFAYLRHLHFMITVITGVVSLFFRCWIQVRYYSFECNESLHHCIFKHLYFVLSIIYLSSFDLTLIIYLNFNLQLIIQYTCYISVFEVLWTNNVSWTRLSIRLHLWSLQSRTETRGTVATKRSFSTLLDNYARITYYG